MPKSRIALEVDEILKTPGSILSDVTSGIARRKEIAARGLGPSIGSTGSGKPVYERAISGDYDGFTRQDHLDAADLHRDFASENRTNYKFRAHHKIADEHDRRAALLAEKPEKPEGRGGRNHAATREVATRDLGPSIYRVVGSDGFDKVMPLRGKTKHQALSVASMIADENRTPVQLLTMAQGKIAESEEIQPATRESSARGQRKEELARRGARSHATTKSSRSSKSRALAISPALVAEKYRPFGRRPWQWWIHLPGSVNSIGEGSTEAKAWQAAAAFLTAKLG